MCLEPERLESGVVQRRKRVRLEDVVEFFEVAAVKGDHRLRFENAFVLVQVVARRQRPQEARQPINTTGVLQYLPANIPHSNTSQLPLTDPRDALPHAHRVVYTKVSK